MSTPPINAPPRRTAYSVHHRLEMDIQSVLSTHSSSITRLQFAAENRRDSSRTADDEEDDMIRAYDDGIQQQIREMENVIKKAEHSTRVAEATSTVAKIDKALRGLTKRSEGTFSILAKQQNSTLKNEKASLESETRRLQRNVRTLEGEKSSLEKEAGELRQQMEQLQTASSSLASEVGELKKKLETQQVEHEQALQQEREQAKKQFAAKNKVLGQQSENGQVKVQYMLQEDEKARIRQQLEEETRRQREEDKVSLKGQVKAEKAHLQKEYDQKADKLKNKHDEKLANLESEHKTALETLEGEHEGALAALRETHKSDRAAIRAEVWREKGNLCQQAGKSAENLRKMLTRQVEAALKEVERRSFVDVENQKEKLRRLAEAAEKGIEEKLTNEHQERLEELDSSFSTRVQDEVALHDAASNERIEATVKARREELEQEFASKEAGASELISQAQSEIVECLEVMSQRSRVEISRLMDAPLAPQVRWLAKQALDFDHFLSSAQDILSEDSPEAQDSFEHDPSPPSSANAAFASEVLGCIAAKTRAVHRRETELAETIKLADSPFLSNPLSSRHLTRPHVHGASSKKAVIRLRKLAELHARRNLIADNSLACIRRRSSHLNGKLRNMSARYARSKTAVHGVRERLIAAKKKADTYRVAGKQVRLQLRETRAVADAWAMRANVLEKELELEC